MQTLQGSGADDAAMPCRKQVQTTFDHATGERRGTSKLKVMDIAFVLSDDKPLPGRNRRWDNLLMRSLGDAWLQGHMAVGVCHFLLDEGVEVAPRLSDEAKPDSRPRRLRAPI